MKKKLFTVLLGLTAAASCALGLAACGGEGSVSEVRDNVNTVNGSMQSTDIDAAYSEAIGLGYAGTQEEFIESLRGADGKDGKNGIDGTGIEKIECNEKLHIIVTLTDGRAVDLGAVTCAHEYAQAEIKEATCTSIGYELRVCSLCGDKDYIFIPEKGHVWDGGIQLIEPDCTQSGIMLYACTECRTNKTETISPKGHDYEDGICKDCNITEFSEGLEFTLTDDGAGYVLNGIGDCTDTDIRIPATYEGLPVVKIAFGAFNANESLKSVSIPRYVTQIGRFAFAHCPALELVYYNAENCADLESWGSDVFNGSGGERGFGAVIGSAVRRVPANLFNWKNSSNKNTAKITSVTFEKDSVCGSIGEKAFYYADIREIILPDSVTVIEDTAFNGCEKLKYVKLGTGVEEIGERAFGFCKNIERFIVYDGLNKLGSMFLEANEKIRYNVSENLCYLGNETNPYVMLMDVADESLETYKINENTKILYDGAFQWCTSLKYVNIPDGVTYLGSVFGYCTNLRELHIPASVSNIRGGINQSYALNKLSVDKDNPVYCEKGNCIIERATGTIVQGCNTSVIPDDGSITAIGDYAFYTLSPESFVNLVIPQSVTSIGDGAFSMCRTIESVVLPKNLTHLGKYAFRDCENLKSIEIPAAIAEIGVQTFMGCKSLERVILPEGITAIGSGAFSGCVGLEAVFYEGAREEWENVSVADYNKELVNAKVYFYSENQPEENWHYVNGEAVIW